jgi:tetratricopeptide (TPR) repeat protein
VPIDREKVLQAAQKFVEKKRLDRAIVEYQRIVQEDPNDARTLLKIGDLQARTQAFEAAIATYERVARHYASQGFSVKAIAVYKQIREIIRKHVPQLAEQYGHIIPKLAQLYQDLGLTGDALSAYDEYAAHLQRTGRDREAIDIFHKIVEINGNNPLTRLRLAEALLRQEESDEALNQFSMASEILLGMGRSDDALKVIERMFFQKPDPALARRAAEIYLDRGRDEDGMQALAKLQICFQADNRDLKTLALLSRAFGAIGQAPKGMEVRKELARIARDKGEFAIAKEAARTLMAEAPNDDAVQTLARSILAAERASAYPGARSEPPPSVQVPVTSSEDAVIEVSEEFVDIPDMTSVELELEPSHAEEGNLEVSAAHQEDFGLDESFEELDPMTDTEIGVLPELDEGPRSMRSVYVPESLQAVEDFGTEQPFDAAAHAREVLANASAFRTHQLYDKALETLRIGLEVNPEAFDLRFALKEMLIESGDFAGACDELMIIAGMYLEAQDVQSGAQLLSEVLALDGRHVPARDLLSQLGYDVSALLSNTGQMRAAAEHDPYAAVDGLPDYESYGAHPAGYERTEPLPSYDLEEINPSYAMSSIPAAERADYAALLTADDPFAAVDGARLVAESGGIDEPFAEGDPLPSFPLSDEGRVPESFDDLDMSFGTSEHVMVTGGAPESGYEDYADFGASEPELLPDEGVEEVPSGRGVETGEVAVAPLAGTRGFRGGDSLEDALEEAEFFASRGLFEDAMGVLEEQGQRFPNHPLLVERMREIAEAMAAAGGSGEHAVPLAPHLEVVEDNAFDIAASLDALDSNLLPQQPEASDGFGKAVDVEEVFAKFKEGVKSQVSESDSQTHYDLGMAYKEMGLLSDAVAEFTMAARDPKRECVCWSMIGIVRTEIGDSDGAIEAFIRGLHAEHKTVEQELALYFELGAIYQARDNPQEALYYFEKVMRRDPNFRDVAQRVRTVQPSTEPSRLKAAGGVDDFDQAFDDLFGTSKLSR